MKDDLLLRFTCLFLTLFVLLHCSGENTSQQDFKNRLDSIDLIAEFAEKDFSRAEQLAKDAWYDSSLFYFEKANVIYEKLAHEKDDIALWKKYIECQIGIASNFEKLGKFELVISNLNEVLEIALSKFGEYHLELAKCFQLMATARMYQASHEEALELNNKALRIRIKMAGNTSQEVSDSYQSIADHYVQRSNPLRAIEYYNKALALRRSLLGENHESVAATLNGIGNAYWQIDPNKAHEYHVKALAIRLQLYKDIHPEIAESYFNIGDNYRVWEDYDTAIDYLNKSLRIFLHFFGEMHWWTAHNYVRLGDLWLAKKDFSRAKEYYDKVLSIRLSLYGETHAQLLEAYEHLTDFYTEAGRHVQAIEYLKKALSIRYDLTAENHTYYAYNYYKLGAIYFDIANYNKAMKCFRKSLEILQRLIGEKHLWIAESYKGLGDIYFKQRDIKSALKYYQQSIVSLVSDFNDSSIFANPPLQNIISESHLLDLLIAKSAAFEAQYKFKSNDLRDLRMSQEALIIALSLVDQMRRSYKAEGSKLLLSQHAKEIYEKAIQSTLRLSRLTKDKTYENLLFTIAEKSKSGILLESLIESRAKKFAGIPTNLLERERQIRGELSFSEKRFYLEQARGKDTDSTSLAFWQDSLFRQNQEYQALLQTFERDYPDYYNLKYNVNTISVEQVQEQILDGNTVLVEYFTGQDSIFIFVITQTSFVLTTVSKGDALEAIVENLREGIIKQDYSLYVNNAHKLYQILVEPVRERLSATNLIIIPDGIISTVPFETVLAKHVRTESGMNDFITLPYLVRDFSINYCYSATLLHEVIKTKSHIPRYDYLGFAPVFPDGVTSDTRRTEFLNANLATGSKRNLRWASGSLPNSEIEVKSISELFRNEYGFFDRLFGKKSKLYLHQEATEKNIKSSTIIDYRFVHIATHGFINEENPKLSGLLLWLDEDSSEDGILHLDEIYNLNLNADLVVLSACESGIGKVIEGEGIIGLTRGFLYAGASNLLVSLWQTSDAAAADLMVEFYSNMLRGSNKTEALRHAKFNLMDSNPEYAKPYYWSSFVLIGR